MLGWRSLAESELLFNAWEGTFLLLLISLEVLGSAWKHKDQAWKLARGTRGHFNLSEAFFMCF